MSKSNIIVGGFVPFTTIDYPDKISAVVFLQGCPWRCIYCSNPHLFEFRKPTQQDKENWDYILNVLKKRIKTLDAVVFSGGEASVQAEEIITAVEDIHSFAPYFKIGLHTNGCFPENLKKISPYIDWIGFDIKAPCHKYYDITKVKGSGERAFESLEYLLSQKKDLEVRTTADPTILTKDDIKEIAKTITQMGVSKYAIQRYRPVDKENPNNPKQSEIMQFFTDKDFIDEIKFIVKNLELRF